MIKKLRMKLIVASMVSLFVVLFIIMGIIGVLNYRHLTADADRVLSVLQENDGKFPEMEERPEDELPQEIPKAQDVYRKKDDLLSPELPYESRYFSAKLDSEGNVITIDTGKIAAVDTSTGTEYAKKVWKDGSSKGFMGDYRYIVYTTDAQTQIIFLDCGRNLNTFRNFVITGAAVSAVGLLSVLLLMIFLSAHIVKPFSENYEKQKRFITDAGHELKTPLTIIDADTEILEMDFGESEWISDIQNQTKRLTDLTNNLILLSRMEEEQTRLQIIEFCLSDMVEETADSFQALAKTQNKTLESNIQHMISMKGDEKNLSQLVTILLDNAVKYSGSEGRISLTLEKQKNTIRLSVFNTADAISREHLEHLFDRFYRTDQSRNSQTGGYGLGLSIAAAIVRAHKGKITASTEDEKSLKITVTFYA